MSNPIEFNSATPRIALPLLFAGQAQKEFFVNEALSRIDGLLNTSIEGEAGAPPAAASEGEAWLVNASPTGEWAGHGGELALRQSGNWLFALPSEGMVVFDKSSRQSIRFDGIWRKASAVASPQSGTTVDTEARAAIAGLIAALVETGILPEE